MSRVGWFLASLVPGMGAVAPWLVLHGLGARAEVVVITGTLPPSGELGVLLGLAYVAAWLVAVLLGPPLLAAALVRGALR